MRTRVLHMTPCPLADVEGVEAWDNLRVDACECPNGFPRGVCASCGGEGRHRRECLYAEEEQ